MFFQWHFFFGISLSVLDRVVLLIEWLQSGCCKPPTACTYNNMETMVSQDPDCYRWNNAPTLLCYDCDSCKAAVLEDIRRTWHKLAVLIVIVLVFLIATYSIGCCAYQNTKRAQMGYPYGVNGMSKVRPRWDYYWWDTLCLSTNLIMINIYTYFWLFNAGGDGGMIEEDGFIS